MQLNFIYWNKMIKRGYKKEISLYSVEGKLTDEALAHCRITGVDPREIEAK